MRGIKVRNSRHSSRKPIRSVSSLRMVASADLAWEMILRM